MRFLVVLTILYSFMFPAIALAHSETSIIRMTQNGFEPQTVTVDENSTVIFINQDKVDHWPASNVHPTHELYPEFDPQRAINPGSSWSFKPKKIGQWKYHDHLLPHLRGTLIVQAELGKVKSVQTNPIATFFNAIKSFFVNFYENFTAALKGGQEVKQLGAQDFKKLGVSQQMDLLKKMVRGKGPKDSWAYFKNTFAGEAGSAGNIHDLAHFIGKLTFEKLGFEGISICTTEFAFGCFHGLLDTAFAKNLDQLNQAEVACGSLGGGGPFASCVHGIGHGIASFYQASNLKAALSSCQRLQSGHEFCFDGVFMEFERAAPSDLYSKDNPYQPCDSLEKEFGSLFSFACGRNQPTVLLSRFKFSFEDLTSVCLNSQSAPFKAACIDALGFIVARSSSDPFYIIEKCKKITVSEYVAKCAKTAAGELIFQDVPLWQEKAPKVCAALPQNYALECNQYLNQLIREYGREVLSDENSYIRKQLKLCFDRGGRDGCYKKAADFLYNQFGLKKSLELLKNNEQFEEVYARCHEVTHYLSRNEFEKVQSINKVYSQCDSTCHGGCYHGTLEAYLKDKGLDKEGVKREFAKICGVRDEYSSPLVFNECLHGLGHAAMFITDMDLLTSLSYCDLISGGDGRERCFGGVFMENSSSSTSFDHKSQFIKADDLFYPCNSLEEKYQPLCWRYQSSYFAEISKNNWPKVVDLCLKIPKLYQEECFRTIGTNQVGFTQDSLVMKANCELAPEGNLQNICIVGVVSSFAYRFVGDSSKMINFCSLVSKQDQEDCFRQIGASFLDWTNDKAVAKNECRKIPDPKGIDWCLSVI